MGNAAILDLVRMQETEAESVGKEISSATTATHGILEAVSILRAGFTNGETVDLLQKLAAEIESMLRDYSSGLGDLKAKHDLLHTSITRLRKVLDTQPANGGRS